MMKKVPTMDQNNNQLNKPFCLSNILNEISGIQRKLAINSPLFVYFGYCQDGSIRLSFLSKSKPLALESTECIIISQVVEPSGGFWTHFNLEEIAQQSVFLSFCQSIIESVENSISEQHAFSCLKKRYQTWKILFKKKNNTIPSKELIQGTFGELLFLKTTMIPKYGVEKAIQSWAGADGKSKDFSIGNDWYEVKTIGSNSAVVKISSLTQLFSNNEGKLVVIKVEGMSEEYREENSCIEEIFDSIRQMINDEAVENIFFSKLASLGIASSSEAMRMRFAIRQFQSYIVDEKFPKLTEVNIPFSEICEAEYSLSLTSLKKYLEL